MAIEFRCACGALCRAEDDQVGQLVHCEACGLDTPVPSADDAAVGDVEACGEAAQALRDQLGGGGIADIVAGLRDTDKEGQGAAEADKRRANTDALREQLGGGGVADLAAALQSDIQEAEALEQEAEEERDHEHDLEDLQGQTLSEDEKGHAAEKTEKHRAATEALRSQLGGGGIGDIVAHMHEDEAALTEAAARADRRRADTEALRSQLGGGGAADIAKALRGEDDTVLDAGDGEGGPAQSGLEAGAPPAAGSPAATARPGPSAAPFRPGAAGRRPAPKKKVLRGHERAAHHLVFKRFIWLPSMFVALACIAVGVGAAVFHIHPREIPALMSGKPSPYEQHMAQFREKLKAANILADGFEIVEHGGRSWAIPQGAENHKTSSGSVYYANEAGFDEPAVDAEDYVKSQSIETGRVTGLLSFGVGLIAVGGVLAILSLFALRDVLMVRAVQRKEEPGADEVIEGEVAEDVQEAGAVEEAVPPEDAEGAEGEADELAAGEGKEVAPGEAEEVSPEEAEEVAPDDAAEGEAEKDKTD